MKSLEKFYSVSSRCESMVDLWREFNSDPELRTHTHRHDDIIRAAIVLKIAAMDHYFTNKFMEIFLPYIQSNGPTKDLLKIVEESGIGLGEALLLFDSKEPYRQIKKRVSYKLKKHVTQSEIKINSLFKCYGIPNLCESAQGRSKDDRLMRNINLLVRRRHSIVHEGDIDNKGREKLLGKTHIIKKLKSVTVLVENCDEILNGLVVINST